MSTSPKSRPLKVVFDSNVYVAAALRPGQYADRWLDIAMLPTSGLRLYASTQILNEVRRKLVQKFGFPEREIRPFIQRLKLSARVVKPSLKLSVASDPDDNAILECAMAARAQLIVTADKDLLKLNPYHGIGIAHPRQLKHIFADDYS